MKLTGRYWLRQASIGLVMGLVLGLLGHFNAAQFRVMPQVTWGDVYLIICWLGFPFAKWILLEDHRAVTAPTFHRKRHRAAEQTSSVYERHQPVRRVQAAPRAPLKVYWLVLIDIFLALGSPLVLVGFVSYLIRHN
ncbi:hypothetical protein [Levilactobacillus zymae]|uniref:hypothetical protein n=1 Tax=Levilactobacillus zymae TaxID=267363 RepID=UPI0028BA9743|nr:hypothetical protein [Levilactobacillus zymae]MDT6981545.1 hypothetical protein [Levilactobacillus zymae]